MILDELTLHNVGLFRGTNRFELTPPSPNKPVVLIGGFNGCGKTTLLDSVQLALYGSAARSAGRRGYQDHLRSLIHRGETKAHIDLRFHVHQEGIAHDYRVRRAWILSGDGVRETLEVFEAGDLDPVLTSEWAERVEAFIPRGIAELFFFDGEKIESLAEPDTAREVLKSAVGSLLGLDLVDKLTADLAIVARQQQAKAAAPQRGADLAVAESEATRARREIEARRHAAAQANNRRMRAEKSLREAEERFRLGGGELYQQRTALEAERAGYQRDKDAAEERMRRIAAGYAPLLLLAPQIERLLERAGVEIAATREAQVLELLSERDRMILDQLRQAGVTHQTITEVEARLTEDHAERSQRAETTQVTGLRESERARIQAYLPQITQSRDEILDAIGQRGKAIDQIERLARQLQAVPAEEALSILVNDRERARDQARDAERDLRAAQDELERAQAAYTEAERVYGRELEKAAQAADDAQDAEYAVRHAQLVQATLANFRTAAAARHLKRIQALILESLRSLMRKSDLIADIAIDPGTYTLSLRGPAGEDVSTQELSAGERQLLAVSLLWGLGRASGRPLPVIIDTPLGRLDSQHRKHLVERYFPHASHQVLLLSTDTEIDADALSGLKTRIGHAYHLHQDKTARFTTVQTGYFWQHDA